MTALGPVAGQAIAALPGSAAPVSVTADMWLYRLAEPVRTRAGLSTGDQQVLAFQPLPFVAFSWFGWLSDPVRKKPGLPAAEQQVLAFSALPIVSFSWFGELSKPRRLDKPGVPAAEQQWIAFQPAPSPFVAVGWGNWLSEPLRLKSGLRASLQQALAWPPRLLPTPTIIGVLNAIEIRDVMLAGGREFNPPVTVKIGLIETSS